MKVIEDKVTVYPPHSLCKADIPVILCTGYSDLVTAESALARGIKAFVIKPLNRLALAETIRQALGESAA